MQSDLAEKIKKKSHWVFRRNGEVYYNSILYYCTPSKNFSRWGPRYWGLAPDMKELVRLSNNSDHIGMPFFFHYDINFKKIPRKRRYDAIRGLGKEATAIYTNFLSGAIFTGERRLMQDFIDSVKCSYKSGVELMASFAGTEAAKERLGGAYLVYDIMAEPHRVIRWRGDKA